MRSFHKWKEGHWAVLCSHPRAFHPVGTTELGSLSQNFDTLRSIGCKVVALSVDSVEAHQEWLKDVEAYNSLQYGKPVKVKFPIISDSDCSISEMYSMIDQYSMGQHTSTVRSVFVINPENILMLRLDYPSCVGVSTCVEPPMS
jgi:thioredoxin-dependent peroxiredoxin